jgi:hypothetical protein
MNEQMSNDLIDRISRNLVGQHNKIKHRLNGLYLQLTDFLINIQKIRNNLDDKPMKDLLFSRTFEWITWSIKRHIFNVIGHKPSNVRNPSNHDNKKTETKRTRVGRVRQTEEELTKAWLFR